MARVFKSACASFDGRKYELTRLRRSRALPTYMTRLNRSRIRYTPGLCGTSCTFFCKSGLAFLGAIVDKIDNRAAKIVGQALRLPPLKGWAGGAPALQLFR